MIHDIPKPDISPNFTIEDIHKIREWNYERMKDAVIEERKSYYNSEISKFELQMEARRAARKAMAASVA